MKTFGTDLTGANRGNGEKHLCSLSSLVLDSGRNTVLAAPKSDEGGPPYVDNPDASGLVAGKPELRNYKAVFVVADKEVSQFSDEITVNCAPLV